MRISIVSLLSLVVLALLAVTGTVVAAGHVQQIVGFDPAAGELPEGVTVDTRGNVYVSVSPLGQLVRVAPGSNTLEHFASVPGLQAGDLGLLGLAADAPGNVYGAVVSSNPDTNGVWKFARKTGAAERVAGTGAIIFPNSVAFDHRGNMYVTDTIAGAVWRVPRGGTAEPWLIDPLLQGNGSAGFGFPIGANGIGIRANTVYVGVTELGTVVTVPILPDGSAGVADVYADVGTPVDGIALDVRGNVYIAAPLANAVLRVNAADGSIDTLASMADGMDAPTSVAFGTSHGERRSLYVVNFSVAVRPPGDPNYPATPNPALLKFDAGVPGLP